jgi:hypothetical protein
MTGTIFIGTFDREGIPQDYNDISCNQDFPFEVELSGDFELRCRYGFHGYSWLTTQIWQSYTRDYDPYGPYPEGFEFYYYPTGNLTASFTVCSTTVTASISTTGMEEDLKYGLGNINIIMTGGQLSVEERCFEPGDIKEFGYVTVSGIGGNYPNNTIEFPNSGEEGLPFIEKAVLENMTLTVWSIGSDSWIEHPYPAIPCSWNLWCGPYSPHITGYIKHLDGTPVAGVRLECEEDYYDVSDSAGYVNLTKDFDGVWELGYFDIFDDEFTLSAGTSEQKEEGCTTHYAPTIVDDDLDLHEPWFPACGGGKGFEDYESGFWDRRTELIPGQFQWEDGIEIAPVSSRKVVEFNDATGWTITPAGAATISVVSGKVQVEVDTDCSIFKSFTGGQTWRGLRYAYITHTTDDDDPITFSVAGRDYDIPSTKLVDLLKIKTPPANDTSQTCFPDDSAGWGWGVGDPGNIEFGGLRAGKTYTFEDVTTKKLPAAQGGHIEVLVTDGAFVGSTMGDSRTTDPYSLFFYVESDPEELAHYLGRKAIVFVDGMPAAELFDMKHYLVPAGGGTSVWRHENLQLSDTLALFPPDGAVQMSEMAPIAGQTDWQNGDIETAFIETGDYPNESGEDVLKLDFKLRCWYMIIPFAMDIPTLSIGTRYLRGRARILAMNDDGTEASNKDIIIKVRRIDDGGVIEVHDGILTDSNGICKTLSLKQPQVQRGFIDSVTDSTHYIVSELSGSAVDHNCVFAGAIGNKPNRRKITEHNQLTGAITIESEPIGDPPDPPGVDAPIYIELDYNHEVIFGSTEDSEIMRFRNHGWSLMMMRLAAIIHGPVYNPLDATVRPDYVPGDGDLPEYI